MKNPGPFKFPNACKRCKAPAGEPCRSASGRKTHPHHERVIEPEAIAAMYEHIHASPGEGRFQLAALYRGLADRIEGPASGRVTLDARQLVEELERAGELEASAGKALAAFERRILPVPGRLDRYAAGERGALFPEEKAGLHRFFETGCAVCHHGPLLLDGAFHANYFPTGRRDGAADPGRAEGWAALLRSEFRGDGPYSDAPAAPWLAGAPPDYPLRGQFKTPTLRGIAETAPYFHGGTAASLEDAVKLYRAAGLPDGDERTTGERDFALAKFPEDAREDAALIAFLRALSGPRSEP